MVLYLEENLFAIFIQTGIWLPSFIMAIITTFNAIKSTGRLRRISMYFALFSWSISITYISWTTRALLFSATASASEWFILWQFAYGPGVLSFFFLALWSISLINPQILEERKWLILILLIPWLIVVIDITILTTPSNAQPTVFANIKDIKPDIILSAFAAIAVFIYTGIPIVNFFRYLLVKENKGTTNYRKIFIIEIGLIFFLLGSLVDAAKPNVNELLFISRLSMATGIILMFFGLKLPKRFHMKGL